MVTDDPLIDRLKEILSGTASTAENSFVFILLSLCGFNSDRSQVLKDDIILSLSALLGENE